MGEALSRARTALPTSRVCRRYRRFHGFARPRQGAGRTAGTAAASIDPEIDRYRDRLVRAPRAHYAPRWRSGSTTSRTESRRRQARSSHRPSGHARWTTGRGTAWLRRPGTRKERRRRSSITPSHRDSRPLRGPRARQPRSCRSPRPPARRCFRTGAGKRLAWRRKAWCGRSIRPRKFQARAASVEIASMERLSPWIRLVAERPEHGKSVELRMTLDRLASPAAWPSYAPAARTGSTGTSRRQRRAGTTSPR